MHVDLARLNNIAPDQLRLLLSGDSSIEQS